MSQWQSPRPDSTNRTVGKGCAYLLLICMAIIVVAITVVFVRWAL